MEYRRLGKSGLQLSALSLGSWVTFGHQIGDNTAEMLMKMAYDKGVNFFDNAEVYAHGKSEIVMGNILKKMGWQRDSYVISSKAFFGKGGKLPTQRGLNRKHLVEACQDALQRLQLEYLDLYYCHRPDPQTPIEETVWTMHQLIMQGKILYWGTSEWSAQEIMEAHTLAARYSLIGPTMEQPQYNLLHRHRVEEEYANLYQNTGLGTTIWSPLASGVLTGKYSEKTPGSTRMELKDLQWLKEANLTPEKLTKAEKVVAIAKEIGVSPAKLSIAWCLKNPNVSTVILGASKTHQLQETLESLDVIPQLTDEVMNQLNLI